MEDVLGYSACRGCGAPHPDLLLQRLGGRCWTCIERKLGEIEVARVLLAGSMSAPRARTHRRGSKGARETAKMAAKAREQASKRLKRCFPDLYEAILCEERAKLGLERVAITPSVRRIDSDGLDRDVEAAKRALEARSA